MFVVYFLFQLPIVVQTENSIHQSDKRKRDSSLCHDFKRFNHKQEIFRIKCQTENNVLGDGQEQITRKSQTTWRYRKGTIRMSSEIAFKAEYNSVKLGRWPCLAHQQLIIRLYLKRKTNKKSFVSKNIHFLHPCVDKFGFYQMFVLLQVVLEVHHGNACEWLHSQRIYLQLPISLFLPFAWSAFIIKRASFALRRDLLILFKTVFLQLISPRFPHCTLLEGLCQASLVVRKYFSLLLYLHLSLVYV